MYTCINREVLKPTYSDETSLDNSKAVDNVNNNGDKSSKQASQYDSMEPSLSTSIPNKEQQIVDDNNNHNNNKIEGSSPHYSNDHKDALGKNTKEDEDGEFDRSYIISSSHGGTRGEPNTNTRGDNDEIESTSDTAEEKEVSIIKAKDQGKLKQQGEVVGGIAVDIFSKYKHITDNTEEFLLFVGLAVALGLGLFLALVVWGMYRSNRLTRIKNRLRKPSSNLMTTSDCTTANGGTMSDIIDAYVNSPITGKTSKQLNFNE